MSDEHSWLTCSFCGGPIEGATLDLDQFETPEDAEAAGPVLDEACVAGYHRDRVLQGSSSVLMYKEGETGPLADSRSGPTDDQAP